MFLRRVTRPRRINNTKKMQERRAGELGGRVTNSDVDRPQLLTGTDPPALSLMEPQSARA
jgi:hypothetical protein